MSEPTEKPASWKSLVCRCGHVADRHMKVPPKTPSSCFDCACVDWNWVQEWVGPPEPQPKRIAHFAATMLANGLPVAIVEFAPGTSTDAIVETTRRIMTQMVGPFSDDSTVENGMVHCRFTTCCAAVEKQKKPGGAVDVVWFFHKAPPKDSALMVLLAQPVTVALKDAN